MLQKYKISLFITILLLLQLIYSTFYNNEQKIQKDFIQPLMVKEKYIQVLESKFNELKTSNLYDKLKTDIKFTDKTKLDITFIFDKKDREKYSLDNNKSLTSFDTTTIYNLHEYHKYIFSLYEHTQNSVINETFLSMLEDMKKINNKINISKELETKILNLMKNYKTYMKELIITRKELILFNTEIESFLKLNYNVYNNRKPTFDEFMSVEKKKMDLFLKMFKNTQNLYINITTNKTNDPFIKFSTFINIYSNLYNIHKSLITEYNQKIEKENNMNKIILFIISIIVILLSWYKEISENKSKIGDIIINEHSLK